MRVKSSLRFLGTVAALVLVFGGFGSLVLGALDKSQTNSAASVFDLGNLAGFVVHFIRETLGVLTTYTDATGTPFRAYFLKGAATTIEFCFISMPLALVFGLVLALMSRSAKRIMRLPARAYVEFFRNTPLIVQMLAIYTGLTFFPPSFLNAYTTGIATLVLNYAAYECENLRAGIQALDRGQGEAAAVLGLGYFQTLRLITIPQMISVVLPPVLNDLIYMYKDSAILSLITIEELTNTASDLARRSPSRFWQFFLLDGMIYLLLSLPLARVARLVEARLKSGAFQPKRDLAGMALLVLTAMAAFGWVAGLLLQGISAANALDALSQLRNAIGLTLGIVVFALVVLGAVVYIPASIISLFRGRAPTKRAPGVEAPVVALSK